MTRRQGAWPTELALPICAPAPSLARAPFDTLRFTPALVPSGSLATRARGGDRPA